MKLTLGILAWNESQHIETTLKSLFAQSLFHDLPHPITSLDLIVVPNGCTDDTDQVANQSLHKLAASAPSVKYKVCPLQKPGKANAWNVLVHDLADPSTDYFLFMDADIAFNQPKTLESMVNAFLHNPEAMAVTDKPLNSIFMQSTLSPVDHLQRSISQSTLAAPAQLCGQMYGLRGATARAIRLPRGLIIEDGFIKDVIVTDFYREPPVLTRIYCVPDASHTFEAEKGLKAIYKHQLRQVIGQTINYRLRQWISLLPPDTDISLKIEELNRTDPQWLLNLLNHSARMGYWHIYPGALTQRFRRLSGASASSLLFRIPVAISALLFDLTVFVVANYKLSRLTSLHSIWPRKPTAK